MRWSLLLALLSGVLSGCGFGTEEAERAVMEARGVGEIRLFSFSLPSNGPFEWIGGEEVVFLTRSGKATVDLETGTVVEINEPRITPSTQSPAPLSSRKLDAGARYGPWEVASGGFSLKTDDSGNVRCSALLVSPEGKYVACSYNATDPMSGSTQSRPAVIRLR